MKLMSLHIVTSNMILFLVKVHIKIKTIISLATSKQSEQENAQELIRLPAEVGEVQRNSMLSTCYNKE